MALLARIAGRLGIFLASVVAASILVFLLCQALPGDVAQVILGNSATPDAVTQLRAQLGLDRPLALRYLEWIGGCLTGDMGSSYVNGASVSGLVAPKLAVTLSLVLPSMVLATLIALPLGMFAALQRRTAWGLIASGLSQVGMSLPAFVAGMLLVTVFATSWHVLPASGYVPLSRDPVRWMRHLLLPVLSLAVVQASILTRYVRSATVEVVQEDYFRTARAIGWGWVGALWRHGVRNIAVSLVTVLGLQLATLLVGAIVVEQVFQLPGLGQLLLTAVSRRDLIIVQGIVLVLVAIVLAINFLVDTLYLLIDPRLRRARHA